MALGLQKRLALQTQLGLDAINGKVGAGPTFYVSATGSNAADGKSPATAGLRHQLVLM